MLHFAAWVVVILGGVGVIVFPPLILRSHGYLGGKRPPRHQVGLVRIWRTFPLWLFMALATARVALILADGLRRPDWESPAICFVGGLVIWSQVESLVEAILSAKRRRADSDRRAQAYLRELSEGPVS